MGLIPFLAFKGTNTRDGQKQKQKYRRKTDTVGALSWANVIKRGKGDDPVKGKELAIKG